MREDSHPTWLGIVAVVLLLLAALVLTC